jgi:hypothetical protein
MEFTYDRYWELPYPYIMDAIISINKLRHQELHENEIPIAVLACQQAEINRDRKKQKKPYTTSDFYCYPIQAEQDTIDARYAASAIRLIELGMFPRWGLFIYKELIKNADESSAAEILAYVCDTAIILAPTDASGACRGLLIAMEAASHRILHFDQIDRNGHVITDCINIRMPHINGKVAAVENCILDIV